MTGAHKKQAPRGKKAGFPAVLLAVVFPGAVFGQTPADFEYTKENGGITITGYRGSARVALMPALLEGLPVTSIGYNAFFRKQLTGVTIPSSVTPLEIARFMRTG
jgi:hypothetical protein